MESKHPTQRANRKVEKFLPCPTCNGTGRELDRDGGGAYFTDCRDCHGEAQVPDVALRALEREGETLPPADEPAKA